ncbi:hypothetical protein vseg_006071 [Gypsophila vaccaria]
MARKSNHHKQRELNLRGRSIARKESVPAQHEHIPTSVDTEDTETSVVTKHGPTENSQSKTKSLNEIVGIPELHVETDEETEDEKCRNDKGEQSMPPENRAENAKSVNEEMEVLEDSLLQLDEEDVSEELAYWRNAVICFIMGANPPGHVIEGFVRRIWTKFNIDKISFLPNGVFLVRFASLEMKDKALNSGYYLFDNKPLIVKEWNEKLEINKEEIKTAPIWIQLHDLPLKFWGKSLPKIVGLVGKFIKGDNATMERTKLGFARVMVEMQIDHPCPDWLHFKDEQGKLQRINITYEWKPVSCLACKGMGHRTHECRRVKQTQPEQPKPRKVWKPKLVDPIVQPRAEVPRNEPSTPLNRQPVLTLEIEELQGGYSNERFGALSYRENKEIGLFGLIETRVKNNALALVQSNFRHWSVTTNNGYHKGGRIWIVWRPEAYHVQFLEYNAQYIHLKVENLARRQSFFYTVVYAFNSAQDRLPLWNHLRKLASMVSGPWAIGGDFNCVLSADEKVGGNLPMGIEQFRRCIADCGMLDVHSVGAFYTWNNRQKAADRVYSKLDRFLINKEWSDCFPDAYAHFLPEGVSDHSPCLIYFSIRDQCRKSFKYYNMWGKADNFLSVVTMAWNCDIQGHPMFRLVSKMKKLKHPLKELNRNAFSNIEIQATEMELKIQKLQEQ